MLLAAQGIESVSPRISKRDERVLRTKGVSTVRKSRKDFHIRSPLNLYFLQHLSQKVFEIHCDEGCSMIDVLWHLSRNYAGDDLGFLVNALKPDDDYTVVHSDSVIIRPEKFMTRKLPSSKNPMSVSAKIRNRSRCLYIVHATNV